MKVFENQNDILKEVETSGDFSWISNNCTMEWPLFSWDNKKSIKKALKQVVDKCYARELVFCGIDSNSSQGAFIYKLSQKEKPTLWCSIWVYGNQEGINKIKFVFDAFEYFKNDEEIEIFGFSKHLENPVQELTIPKDIQSSEDKEVFLIMNAIKEFFSRQYGFPVQNTKIANERLYRAAINAKNALKNKSTYTIILPFFSANNIGPIQFCAKIKKIDELYRVEAS